MSELRDLALTVLDQHPDNPRLQLREDVVERLTAEISRSGFGREHALLVRPVGGRYQIVSGHHRAEAAQRAGLDVVPAWVREMDDDEAFMQLVLSNTHGELSPLEIGMHALRAVPLAQGKSGGGLKAYAERIGRTGEYVGQLRSAADVLTSLPNSSLEVSDKAKHLYEISKAPRAAWPLLVERLVAKGWTVADTSREVEQIRKFNVPDEWAEWLPLADLVSAHLRTGKPSAAAVEQLISTVEGIFAAIERDGTTEDADAFRAWLAEHRGKESWDRRQISGYHVNLIREWAARVEAEAARIAEEEIANQPKLPAGVDLRLGDFRDVLKDLPDGSVDAIVTDPPYPAEFLPLFADLADLAAQTLKPGGLCAVMVGQSYLPQVYELMTRDDLAYHWTLAYLTPGGQATQLWQRKVNTFWKPVLVYVKGEYNGPWLGDVAQSAVNDNDKRHHHWGQSESGMADLIERLTRPGDLICDPFLGGGTTGLVAHGLGRRFVGCDIDEQHVQTTVERFAQMSAVTA